MLDPDLQHFVRGALPPPPARVLEVGAGQGELAAWLRSAGYDVIAIDPAAETPEVRPVALADLDEPAGSFDAAVAVVSLHHVEPLEPSLEHLAALLRPGARLVVDEFDVERVDAAAVRWMLARRDASHDHAPTPEAVIDELRRHCHPLRTLHAGLAPWFELTEPVRGAYLHRWNLPPGHRAAELEGIAAGALPATGARFTGTRR